MRGLVLFLGIFSVLNVWANDGAYYVSGNQLIPISDSEVCVTKEILTIEREIQ